MKNGFCRPSFQFHFSPLCWMEESRSFILRISMTLLLLEIEKSKVKGLSDEYNFSTFWGGFMQIKLGELSNKAFSSSSTFSLLGSVMHIPYRVYQEGVMFISKRTASLAEQTYKMGIWSVNVFESWILKLCSDWVYSWSKDYRYLLVFLYWQEMYSAAIFVL